VPRGTGGGVTVRSKGSVTFERLCIPQGEMFRRLKCSAGTVSNWTTGLKRPNPEARKLLLAEFGIPVESWDEPSRPTPLPAPGAVATTAPVPAARGREQTVNERVASVEGLIDALMLSVTTDADSTPNEQARVLSSLTVSLAALRRLKGEEITEQKVTRQPKWIRLRDSILDALSAFPDALASVIAALDAEEAADDK
jgi:transcriptional regulator with XRE-family HTH domain